MRRKKILLIGLLAMFLAAACGGPNIPLKVGVRDVATDVILGAQEVLPPPAPPPSGNLEPGFPLAIQPPALQIIDEEPPPAECPEAGEFEAPSLAAELRIFEPPAEGAYEFRHEGGFLEVGPAPEHGLFPEKSVRRVTEIQRTPSPEVFGFTVIWDFGNTITTTSYVVIRNSDVPNAAPYGGPGLYIAQIVTRQADGSTDAFTPQPPLKLLEFPIIAGANWRTYGVDGANGSAMGWTARVGREVPDGEDDERSGADPIYRPDTIPKARVNACGSVIDAWWVQVTEGRFVASGKTKALEFQALYGIASQFGGLIVSESVTLDGFEGPSHIVHELKSTISDLPSSS